MRVGEAGERRSGRRGRRRPGVASAVSCDADAAGDAVARDRERARDRQRRIERADDAVLEDHGETSRDMERGVFDHVTPQRADRRREPALLRARRCSRSATSWRWSSSSGCRLRVPTASRTSVARRARPPASPAARRVRRRRPRDGRRVPRGGARRRRARQRPPGIRPRLPRVLLRRVRARPGRQQRRGRHRDDRRRRCDHVDLWRGLGLSRASTGVLRAIVLAPLGYASSHGRTSGAAAAELAGRPLDRPQDDEPRERERPRRVRGRATGPTVDAFRRVATRGGLPRQRRRRASGAVPARATTAPSSSIRDGNNVEAVLPRSVSGPRSGSRSEYTARRWPATR